MLNRTLLFIGLALLLAACAGDHPRSDCDQPRASGYYSGCVYYPGYGWGPWPVQHGSAPGASF